MTDTIRVTIVDDDALVRAGLALILGGDSVIEVVGEAGNGREGLDLLARVPTDVVLMDIRMPEMDGLAATAAARELATPPKVIVLTTFDADGYVLRALSTGASGFLLKDTPPAAIIEAIKRVADGDPMLSPSVTEQLIRQVTQSSATVDGPEATLLAEALTERERDVAVAIGRGQSNAEIAISLHMSVATVKAHISHIFIKLGATNRVHVAIRMHEAGLL